MDMVVDLFDLDEPPLPSLGKQPDTDDPEPVRLEGGITEEKLFELNRVHLIQDEEAQ